MKNIAEEAEKIIDDLDRSQGELEEMAYELLNALDHVKKHNGELHRTLELIVPEGSEKVTGEAIENLNVDLAKLTRAIEVLESLVHKNEEMCAEQQKNVEEAKQAVDFLRCTYDWDKL